VSIAAAGALILRAAEFVARDVTTYRNPRGGGTPRDNAQNPSKTANGTWMLLCIEHAAA
jgi:hypothetical protein